jgi:hypothetical protein
MKWFQLKYAETSQAHAALKDGSLAVALTLCRMPLGPEWPSYAGDPLRKVCPVCRRLLSGDDTTRVLIGRTRRGSPV